MTRVSMDVRFMPPKTDDGESNLGIFAARPEWCVDANAATPNQSSARPAG